MKQSEMKRILLEYAAKLAEDALEPNLSHYQSGSIYGKLWACSIIALRFGWRDIDEKIETIINEVELKLGYVK